MSADLTMSQFLTKADLEGARAEAAARGSDAISFVGISAPPSVSVIKVEASEDGKTWVTVEGVRE